MENIRNEFETILMQTKLNSLMEKEEIEKESFPLLNFVRGNMPKTLYRFRQCNEYSLDAFDKDEIWLSNARQFNDMHDTLMYIDIKNIEKKIELAFNVDNIENKLLALKRDEKFPNEIKLTEDVSNILVRKFSEISEKKLKDFWNDNRMNFYEYIEERLKELKIYLRKKIKIACLSENINSPLMWAHYADFDKGFALGYDFSDNTISQCSNCPKRDCLKIKNATIYPVIYSKQRFDVTDFAEWYIKQGLLKQIGSQLEENFSDELIFTKISLHKGYDWSYEKEWRIICSTLDSKLENSDRYAISKRPNALYLGCQTSNVMKKFLVMLARKKEIPIYQMEVDESSKEYKLNYKKIEV